MFDLVLSALVSKALVKLSALSVTPVQRSGSFALTPGKKVYYGFVQNL